MGVRVGKNGHAIYYAPNPRTEHEWKKRAVCACSCGCGLSLYEPGVLTCPGCVRGEHRPACVIARSEGVDAA
jgi:hypothetical protein